MAKHGKKPGAGRWIQELVTRDSVEESEGTFSEENSPEEIAIELKRKAPDFQAAIGKVTLYMNRAGKRLSQSRMKELEKVKIILRELYNRKDRQRANKDRPIKVDIKKASANKIALMHGVWVDENNKRHMGDQFHELLTISKEQAEKVHPEVKWEYLEEYKNWLINHYGYEVPKDEDKKIKILEKVRQLMHRDYLNFTKKENELEEKGLPVVTEEVGETKRGVPFWEYGLLGFKPENFKSIDIKRVAHINVKWVDQEDEFVFASANDAISYLADLIDLPVKIATTKESCPECQKKSMDENRFCVACQKKMA